MHISKAVEFGQVHQDPCRTPPISLPAETAVANAPAWRAVPIRVQQSILDLFPITVSKAGAAELASDAPAFWVSTVGFGVNGFLAALMTSRSQGTVVYLLPRVAADVLQLFLCNVFYRADDVREGHGSRPATSWHVIVIHVAIHGLPLPHQHVLILLFFLFLLHGQGAQGPKGP